MLEDIQDLVAVAALRKAGTISFDEMKRRLKKDGLLSGSIQSLST
jgi:hypothetical protein